MADLVTLTLNPALDVTTVTPEVVHSRKLRCQTPLYEAGGGGINVAKVAAVLGLDATAVYPYGGASGRRINALLETDAVRTRPVRAEGITRESLTVLDASDGREYRFVLPGPDLQPEELDRCLAELDAAAAGARAVVLSGSMPPGTRPGVVAEVARIARERGAELVLDTSGDALKEVAGAVLLVKPSIGELCDWVGRDLASHAEIAAAAREIVDRGDSRTVVVSLGPDGAILVSADDAVHARSIDVPVQSAVAAGDHMVAGLLTGLLRDLPAAEVLALGIGTAAAALLTPGSRVCRAHDAERYTDQASAAGVTEVTW